MFALLVAPIVIFAFILVIAFCFAAIAGGAMLTVRAGALSHSLLSSKPGYTGSFLNKVCDHLRKQELPCPVEIELGCYVLALALIVGSPLAGCYIAALGIAVTLACSIVESIERKPMLRAFSGN